MLQSLFTRFNIQLLRGGKTKMKLATNKWNISEIGKNKPVLYYGFKLKKEAQAFVDNWNKTHELKIEVIKY